MFKKTIVYILNAMKKKAELPQLVHYNAAETMVDYESSWDAAFTLTVASGDLNIRPPSSRSSLAKQTEKDSLRVRGGTVVSIC
jgi:hypothetical protein